MANMKDNPPNRASIREYAPRFAKRLSWGSIIAATFVILAVQITLTLLGMAIGFSTINPTTEQSPFAGITTGAAIWWALSFIISLFIGGWFAGRLSGIPSRFSGAVHGIISWGFASVIMVYFLTTTLGVLIGGTFGVVRSTIAGTGQVLAAVAPYAAQATGQAAESADVTWSQIRQEAMQLLRGEGDQAAAGNEVTEALRRLLQNPDQVTEQDREAFVDVLAARTELSREEARDRVDSWINSYQSALAQAQGTASDVAQQAEQYLEQAAGALATAALWAFIMMLLGGIAAAVGGALGSPFDEGTRAYYTERPMGAERIATEYPQEVGTR